MTRIILAMLLILNFGTANAANFEPERERLICALSSMAAYQGEAGELTKSFFVFSLLFFAF